MGRYVITLFLAYLIVIPSVVSAVETDKPIEFPGLWGTFTPEPGAWSEYVKSDKVTGKRTVTRMSIVGVDGDSYWYEVADREGKSSNIVKMLVSHGAGAKSLIKEEPAMTVQPPGVPDGMVPGMGGAGPGTDIRQIPGMGTGYESRQ